MPIETDAILHSQGQFEPQRVNNWTLVINSISLPQLSSNEIYLALKSFPFPTVQFSRKAIRWGNESRFYAGALSDVSEQTVTFRDYIDVPTAQLIEQWCGLVWNPAHASMGLARNYKMNGVLHLWPVNSDTLSDALQVSRTWYVQGIMPLSFNMGTMDMDSDGENVMIEVSLSIDRAYPGDAQGNYNLNLVGVQGFDKSGN